MMSKKPDINSKQALFRNMFVGVMIYSVVLGFFNDYTNILHTGTYSTTFAVAIVLQILTYLTFALKDKIVAWFDKRESKNKYGLIGSIWLVMFVSKFVFLGAISVIFGQEVYISGFVGLFVIIIIMTLAERLVIFADNKLSDR